MDSRLRGLLKFLGVEGSQSLGAGCHDFYNPEAAKRFQCFLDFKQKQEIERQEKKDKEARSLAARRHEMI